MINERMYQLGSQPNYIRKLYAHGLERKAAIGEENVFDYSIGNPSIPAPVRAFPAPETVPAAHGRRPAPARPGRRSAPARRCPPTAPRPGIGAAIPPPTAHGRRRRTARHACRTSAACIAGIAPDGMDAVP